MTKEEINKLRPGDYIHDSKGNNFKFLGLDDKGRIIATPLNLRLVEKDTRMPLVQCSAKQLEAAQRLYEAAVKLINTSTRAAYGEVLLVSPDNLSELVVAVSKCKEEFEKSA